MKLRLAAAFCAALLISACGGGGSPDPVTPSLGNGPPADPAPSSPPTPAPTPQPTPENKVPTPTPVGETFGDVVSKTIGAAGGELSTGDGAIAVIVPAGAFPNNEVVSIQEITNEAHGAKGRAFRISPEGLNTPVPMTIRLRYTDEQLAGTTLEALQIAYQEADRTWRVYSDPLVDTNAKTLSITTRHFSDWSLVAGMQLLPNSARVKIGQTLELRVLVCDNEPVEEDDDLLVPLVAELLSCATAPLNAFTVGNWSVNGVEGGSSQSGTVVADSNQWSGKATYTAPATQPTPNVVSVSAQHRSLADDAMHLLVSNITIDDAVSGCEAFATIDRFAADLSFDAFSFTSTAEYRRHVGKHAGRLVGTLKKVETGPVNFGFWVTYLEPLQGGHVSIDDTYSYEPPHSGGYTGSMVGSGKPYDAIDAPSFIGLTLHYDTCTFDLVGSFIVEGTLTHDGQVSNTKVGVGGLAIFGEPIAVDQASVTTLQGTRLLPALHNTQTTTGYVPVQDVSTVWSISGSTTARWSITPQ